MRSTYAVAAFVLGLAASPALWAHSLHVADAGCGYDTDYDVQVTDAGIRFERDHGKPAEVFLSDGRLRVDGREQAVSPADALRLRRYESQVRALLPEAAGVARDGVDIAYSALTTVVATFADSPEQRERLVDRLNARHAEALQRVDRGLGSGVWRVRDLEALLESGVEDAVGDLVGTVAAGAVEAALSGDHARMAALEARAESLDRSIDREVDRRSERLERRAKAMCPRLDELAQLEQDFQFRLADGSRLDLIERDRVHGKVIASAKD